ncbi:glycosyltransferase [Spirulina subsalsa]|uniref:glycosyltransferase n=1 Tax=Spirulina subsalsa TaxID=54311 RepID=UPI0002F65F12|nr:glycosyltransferase [Spirulina subsalsa]
MLKASVIIPIYNGIEDLPDLLACLKAQTYPASQVEYLLVDNNSTDNTFEQLQAARQDFAQQGLTLHPLQEPKIQSSYAARNKGICAAQSELLAFTDADCRPQPTWLENLLKPFNQANIGLAVGEILALPSENLLEKYAERKDTLSQKHTLNHSFCPYGQTANLAIRKQAFRDVGLFRPYLTTGGDADICWRILRATDWQFQFVEDAVVQHRHRASLAELRSQWRRYGRSNRYLHDLHGVALGTEINPQKTVYRLSRWLLKELPIATLKLVVGQAKTVDLINTPLDLVTFYARSRGQQQAVLPDAAREIPPFPDLRSDLR